MSDESRVSLSGERTLSPEAQKKIAALIRATECQRCEPEVARNGMEIVSLKTFIASLESERASLREFVDWCMRDGSWMGGDIDGGDAQDKAEELGLIVEVPADEEFRAEYDSDTMFVLAWRLSSTPQGAPK